jgi:hypothetical protein
MKLLRCETLIMRVHANNHRINFFRERDALFVKETRCVAKGKEFSFWHPHVTTAWRPSIMPSIHPSRRCRRSPPAASRGSAQPCFLTLEPSFKTWLVVKESRFLEACSAERFDGIKLFFFPLISAEIGLKQKANCMMASLFFLI